MTIRLTNKRKQILELLEKHPRTLSAAEIHCQLPNIDLATIYRNLDLFVQERLIKRVHLGGEEARFEYQKEPHHHAVCTNCHKVLHFTTPDKKLKKLLGLKGFAIDEIEVTVRGVCQKQNHRRKKK